LQEHSRISKITWVFCKDSINDSVPWGPHSLSTLLNLDGVEIDLEEAEMGFLYRRNSADGKVEKIVYSGEKTFSLTPVEPLHLPGKPSSHLLIDFKYKALLEPHTKRTVYATFPIEIAVTTGRVPSTASVIDIFSLGKLKRTLYGPIRSGLICKYWQSELYNNPPICNPVTEGVVRIEIHNTTSVQVEINKVVFSAQGMKIYYGPRLVCMNAIMKIVSDSDAETSFLDQPLENGLQLAPELFRSGFLTQQGKMLMEEGY